MRFWIEFGLNLFDLKLSDCCKRGGAFEKGDEFFTGLLLGIWVRSSTFYFLGVISLFLFSLISRNLGGAFFSLLLLISVVLCLFS